jgi:serine/threonine protein kinase
MIAPEDLSHAPTADGDGPDRYDLREVIGEGAFGRVYDARAPLGRVVAVKALHASAKRPGP